jgi:hypothetical protein
VFSLVWGENEGGGGSERLVMVLLPGGNGLLIYRIVTIMSISS